MLKYLIEFIGTFILLSVILSSGEAIPVGITLSALIYWGGSVSGANFNPAISIMMYLNKKLSLIDMILYIICQIIGGVAALLLFKQTS